MLILSFDSRSFGCSLTGNKYSLTRAHTYARSFLP